MQPATTKASTSSAVHVATLTTRTRPISPSWAVAMKQTTIFPNITIMAAALVPDPVPEEVASKIPTEAFWDWADGDMGVVVVVQEERVGPPLEWALGFRGKIDLCFSFWGTWG